MNRFSFFKIKLVNFMIQILILSLFIYLFDYEFKINFDKKISKERRDIIQFLANYIMFNTENSFSVYLIIIAWIIVSLIPIINYKDYKSAYSMNLSTFFFPNFFFFLFLYRYSPNYYNAYFNTLLTHTLIIGFCIVIESIGITFLLKKIKKSKIDTQFEDLKLLVKKSSTKCPKCGTEFNSIPQYCYNCLEEIKNYEFIKER